MTDKEFNLLISKMGKVQRLHMKLSRKLLERGVEPAEVMTGSLFATLLSCADGMHSTILAIDWIRTTIDTIERSHLDELRNPGAG